MSNATRARKTNRTVSLRYQPFVAHDKGMTKRYMSKRQIAAHLGITEGALTALEKTRTFPAPDVIVGEGPRATRGWTQKSIDEWNQNRPGSGNWGRESKTVAAKERARKRASA